MINVTLLAALLLSGCLGDNSIPAPTVRVIMLDASPMLPAYVSGVKAWEDVGFDVEPSGMPECGYNWYAFAETDCEITIGIYRSPTLLTTRHTQALSDRSMRTITIDSSVTSTYDLVRMVAHESGHILLDTAEHTQGGVMSGASTVVGEQDRELACRSVGLGC